MIKKKSKISPLDFIISLILLGIVVYATYRVSVGLNYKWSWGFLPQYFFRYDEEKGRWVMNLLMQGLNTTIWLSVWSTILATVMGTFMAFFRISKGLFQRLIGRTYVELIRNLPPLVLIFIFYFFASEQIMPVLGVDEWVRSLPETLKPLLSFFFAEPMRFSAFLSGVLTISLFEAAYITEIVRAGIQAIERGQWEASYALGLSWWQQMRHIILPQAIQRILPPLAGEFINTIKNSSIVSIISIQELTFQGMELMAATYRTFEVWLTIMGMYLVLTFFLSMCAARFEAYVRRSLA